MGASSCGTMVGGVIVTWIMSPVAMMKSPTARTVDRAGLPFRADRPARPTAPWPLPPPAAPRDDRAVIHEVDESLRALVKRDVVTDGEIDVVFDAPTREWSSKRS